jgi:2-oxoacid:acceptor oxidoreductase delta subunit (pyruvate/2-ketoisovalerate family)
MGKIKVLRKFEEVVAVVKNRQYSYHWRPEYLEDLGEGPRCCACMGVPASEGAADFIMKGYKVVMHKEKCTKCGACWVYCPLGVIREAENGYFEIDADYCRPCGICAHECHFDAIELTKVGEG